MLKTDDKVPVGSLNEKWTKYKAESKLINPNNKRKKDCSPNKRIVFPFIINTFIECQFKLGYISEG